MNLFAKLKPILIKLKKKVSFHDPFMPEMSIACLFLSNTVLIIVDLGR